MASCAEVQRLVVKLLALQEGDPKVEDLKSLTEDDNGDAITKCRCKELQNEIASLQASADSTNSENAHLQVTVSTLQSRVAALSAQHTALQMANTQLVTEKEEVRCPSFSPEDPSKIRKLLVERQNV